MAKKKVAKKKRPAPTPQAMEAAHKANIGNQWYRLRSKHGRDKLFESPELLWEAACEYFQYVDDHPEMMVKPMSKSMGQNSGSEIELVEVPVRQPYTLERFCLYTRCDPSYIRTFKSVNKNKCEDFLAVIAEIEKTIYSQKYNGAASGFFNANIISRDLGLVDRQDMTSGNAPIQAPVINTYKTGPALEDNSTTRTKK